MPDGSTKFQTYYTAQPAPDPFHPKFVGQDLLNHGFDPRLVTMWQTIPRLSPNGQLDPRRGPAGSAPYENGFDTRNGVIVATYNYRYLDRQKQLPWSELIYWTWRSAQAHQHGGLISNLRTVVRQNIANEVTWAVLDTLYRNRGLFDDDPTWIKWTMGEQGHTFEALLGTDNVKGVVWLLNDHAAEMKKKTIKEIWTRWAHGGLDIWIEIAPAARDIDPSTSR
ncbi:MAG: hypothetical protein Q9179_001084 [Wetmoreana sp. 5 TL-2023]